MATKHKRHSHRISLLQALAPFLVDWWCSHRSWWTPWKLWWLWTALDEDERRRDNR